jgi:hypothetical protein
LLAGFGYDFYKESQPLASKALPCYQILTLSRPYVPRERMGFLLRFSHAATHEALALPALNPDFLYAALDATAYAAFVKESRKKRAGATKLHRKSGEARDQSRAPFTER